MRYIKMLVLFVAAFFAASVTNAALISDSSSGGSGTAYITTGEFGFEEVYYSDYGFNAWYDTETGDGEYIYTVYGASEYTVYLVATEGVWSQVSYYGEAGSPSFATYFWSQL